MKRSEFLPFALPDVGDEEIAEIRDSLASGWVTTGPKTRKFEIEFAAAVGAKHSIAVNSCTAAMHLALESIGIEPGDEVITTPYTFAASAEIIRHFDATPVFVDVDPDSLNIDPEKVEDSVTERTRAIIPVHIGGLPAELDRLHEIADKNDLRVIEDAAHTFPATYKGRKIGGLSDFTGFSFYATKTITTGEGGMICTDNADWAERCRIMALHGISKDAWNRYTAEGSWYYEILAPGFKYNMTDVAAGMGLAQLAKADEMWKRRKEIAAQYDETLGSCDEIQIPHRRDDCEHAWHLYMLRLNLGRLDIPRDQFIQEMKRRNIGTSVHFIPLHVHPYYRNTYGYEPLEFPVAFSEYERELSLPIYSKMTDGDVQDVIDAVLDAIVSNKIAVSAA